MREVAHARGASRWRRGAGGWVGVLLGLAAAGCAPAPPRPVLRVMPLGDSITQGSRHHESYRRDLWRRLATDGYAVDFVGSSRRNRGGWSRHDDFDQDHEGHWGWQVDELLEKLDAWIAAARPDIVLVHLGSNDALRGEEAAQTEAELRDLVARLRAANPSVSILLAELIPARGADTAIRDLNTRIRELGALDRPEARLLVVDHFTDFDPNRHTYDGVHPNGEGARLMADRWYATLRPLLDARGSKSSP